jgi:Raf kinase inhibitor-like YbhB/YbcL family protein
MSHSKILHKLGEEEMRLQRTRRVATALAAIGLGMATSGAAMAQAKLFTVTTPGIPDGGMLPHDMSCGAPGGTGKDESPPLQWSNAPAGTKSFAVLIFDPEGAKGTGVTHWLAYGIAPTTTSLALGDGMKASDKMTGGTNTRGSTVYLGACPPAGEKPHHYTAIVYATDLAPNALAPGLKKDAFFDAVRPHVLRVAGTVLQFGR